MKIKNFKLNSTDQVIVKVTGEVLRAFHIEEAGENDAVDYDKFEIFNHVFNGNVQTKLTVKKVGGGEKKFTALESVNKNEKYGAEVHRLIKKNLYTILTRDLKLEGVPYGIMHGVRPTKIIHRWIREGFGLTSHGIVDKDKIARRLRTDYLANYDKSWLLTEVAIRQIPILNSGDDKTIGIYVGIPFCVTRCLYCSFPSNVLPNDDRVAEFMKVLAKDIDAAAAEIKRYNFKVQSIYIGGGTPTALPERFFAEMMSKVTEAFYSETVEEFTVECGRPDTITERKISALKRCHVTRVSVNPQTMQQKTLNRIGRQHSIEQVYSAFKELRDAGDWKINMDLILGLPGENLDDVKDSLEKVLDLKPDDVTLHALAIKRGSQLQTQISDDVAKIEDFELPPDEEVRKMADFAENLLRRKKYLPYYLYRQGYISGQIENIGYCLPGAEGIYNIQIMDERQTILGVGVAATTKVPDNENLRLQTSFNAKDLTTYLRDVDKYIGNRAKTLDEIYNPVEKAETVESVESVEEIKSAVENVKPVEEIKSALENVKPVEEIKSAVEDVKTVEEIKSAVENVKPVEEIKSAVENVKPVEEIKSAVENVNPVEEIKSAVEDVKPVAENKPSTERFRFSRQQPTFESSKPTTEKFRFSRQQPTFEGTKSAAEKVESAAENKTSEVQPRRKFQISFERTRPVESGSSRFQSRFQATETAAKPAEEKPKFSAETAKEDAFNNFVSDISETSNISNEETTENTENARPRFNYRRNKKFQRHTNRED